MSVQTQKNVMSVMVAGAGNTTISSITNDLANLAEGQVIALGLGASGEVVLPTATTNIPSVYPSIRFVVNQGGVFLYSPRIYADSVISAKTKSYAAAAEQVTTLGYNGTSGSIDASSTDYTLTYVGNWDTQMWEKQKYRKPYDYFTNTPTQQGIAQNLSFLYNKDMFMATLNGTGAYSKCEVLCDGTAAFTASGTATLLGVVNGSDIVNIYSTGTTKTTDTGIESVGAILRIGNTSTSATGKGTGVPVYVVTATSSTDTTLVAGQVRIHTYFQGLTDAAVALGTDAGIVATATNWGLKISSLPLTFGIPPYSDFRYEKASFSIQVKGFGATTGPTTSTVASKGYGTSSAVKEYEYFSSGNEGALNRTVIPLPSGKNYASTTNSAITSYDTLFFEITNKEGASPITAPARMRQEIFVFIPSTYSGGNRAKFVSQIDDWFAALPIPITVA